MDITGCCSVILSGLESPDINSAFFSKSVILHFKKSKFSSKEQTGFNDILKMSRSSGLCLISNRLLLDKNRVKASLSRNFMLSMADIYDAIEGNRVSIGIIQNWALLLAVFRSLERVIDVGFNSDELLTICANGIINQARN